MLVPIALILGVQAKATPFVPDYAAKRLTEMADSYSLGADMLKCKNQTDRLRPQCDLKTKALQTHAASLRRRAAEVASGGAGCGRVASRFQTAYLRISPSHPDAAQIDAIMAAQGPFVSECLRPPADVSSTDNSHVAMVRLSDSHAPHCTALLLRHVVVTAAHCWYNGKQPVRRLHVTPLSQTPAFNLDLGANDAPELRGSIARDFVPRPYPPDAQPPPSTIAIDSSARGMVRVTGHFHSWSNTPGPDHNPRQAAQNQCAAVTATDQCISLMCQTTGGFSGAPIFSGEGPTLAVVGLVSQGLAGEGYPSGCSKDAIQHMTYAVVLPPNIDVRVKGE